MEQYKYIDLTYLRSISGGNIELIMEMIDIFKQQIPEFNFNFQNALKSDDWKGIAAVAHKARSSVSIMGIARIAAVLKEMETKTKEKSGKDIIIEWVRDFEITTAEAIKELDIELKIIGEIDESK